MRSLALSAAGGDSHRCSFSRSSTTHTHVTTLILFLFCPETFFAKNVRNWFTYLPGVGTVGRDGAADDLGCGDVGARRRKGDASGAAHVSGGGLRRQRRGLHQRRELGISAAAGLATTRVGAGGGAHRRQQQHHNDAAHSGESQCQLKLRKRMLRQVVK